MGWIWASPSPPKPSTPVQDQRPPPPAASAPTEHVDPEVQKFLDLFKEDHTATQKPAPAPASKSAIAPSDTSKPSSTSKSADSSSSSWLSLRSSRSATPPAPAPPLDAVSESLLPTDMSCRQAFDLGWACNSLGGQWNAVYRYGNMRSCSEHWDDFWFCMRTKNYATEAKAEAVRARYRDKEHAKYGPGKPSSEDVWEARTEKVPPGSAFAQSMDAPPPISDEEWREMENERRRRIRQGLGFDKAAS